MNWLDAKGYSPLMHAAKQGHGKATEVHCSITEPWPDAQHPAAPRFGHCGHSLMTPPSPHPTHRPPPTITTTTTNATHRYPPPTRHRQVLLKYKADPNAKNKAGLSCLMIAATRGSADVVKHLLETGVDVQTTALMIAAERGHARVAKLLAAALDEQHNDSRMSNRLKEEDI